MTAPDLFGYVPPPTRPYQPSNGEEGWRFCERFCWRCRHDSEEQPCEILARTTIHRIGDPEYPPEWVEDDVPGIDTHPRCTAFEAAA